MCEFRDSDAHFLVSSQTRAVVTHLKTYASISSLRLKLIISQRTDFNRASHIDLKEDKRNTALKTNHSIVAINFTRSYHVLAGREIYIEIASISTLHFTNDCYCGMLSDVQCTHIWNDSRKEEEAA